MPYILDGIIVVTVLICVLLSAKKGFAFTIVEAAGFIAAIILTFNISTPAANIIYDNLFEQPIINSIENTQNEAETAVVDVVWNKLPGFVTENNFFGISKDDISTVDNDNDLPQKITNTFIEPVLVKILSIIILQHLCA